MAELRRVTADELDPRDVIFDSFRLDYPGFDGWLGKAASERRPCWFVDRGVAAGRSRYAGVCIVHPDNPNDYRWNEVSLKICSLKVDPLEGSLGWGETLIRKAVEEAVLSGAESAFVEVFPKQVRLIALLLTFGFFPIVASAKGECVMRLRVRPMGMSP